MLFFCCNFSPYETPKAESERMSDARVIYLKFQLQEQEWRIGQTRKDKNRYKGRKSWYKSRIWTWLLLGTNGWGLLKRLTECTIPPNHPREGWKYRAFICQLPFPLVKLCHMGHKFSHISMCVQASQAADVKEGSYGLRPGHSGCTYTKQVNMCADLFSATMIRKKMRPSGSTV